MLKGSLSRCGDSVSLPMDRDRPIPPFIFPEKRSPYPTPLAGSLPLHPNPGDTRSTTTFPRPRHPILHQPNKRSTNPSSSPPPQQPGKTNQQNFQIVKTGPNSGNSHSRQTYTTNASHQLQLLMNTEVGKVQRRLNQM